MINKTSININSQQTETFCVPDIILAHNTLSYMSFSLHNLTEEVGSVKYKCGKRKKAEKLAS